MKESEAIVGTRVRSLVEFSGVRKGTKGVIDEDYGTGVMVAWDLPERPLPSGYCAYTAHSVREYGVLLRDGFDKRGELHFLEVVR